MYDADLPCTCLCMTELMSYDLNIYGSARACIKHQRDIHALRPGYVLNIKGKYMPSVWHAVLYHIYSDYRYL